MAFPQFQVYSRAHLRLENLNIGATRQPLDAFLVLDVEGTCVEGSSFDYPNEIIASSCFLFLATVILTVDLRLRSGQYVLCVGKTKIPRQGAPGSFESWMNSEASSDLHGDHSYPHSARI